MYDELVDLAKPGDRVCVSGIFRSVGVGANPRQRTLKSLFRTFVDAVHVGVMFVSSSSSGEGIGLDKSTRLLEIQGKRADWLDNGDLRSRMYFYFFIVCTRIYGLAYIYWGIDKVVPYRIAPALSLT